MIVILIENRTKSVRRLHMTMTKLKKFNGFLDQSAFNSQYEKYTTSQVPVFRFQ